MLRLHILSIFITIVCRLSYRECRGLLGEVQVSSDAAAAIKTNPDGLKQTFISSQSKAKSEGDEGSKKPIDLISEPLINVRKAPAPNNVTWGYKECDNCISPKRWSEAYSQCGGYSQSPIPLSTGTNGSLAQMMDPIKLTGLDNAGTVYGALKNNGHTFGMEIDLTLSNITLSGGPLGTDSYILNQFHFHYSCSEDPASEHVVDGVKYIGEFHMLFTNKKYPSNKEAMDKSDGVGVIAFFIKASSLPNLGMMILTRQLIDILNPHSSNILSSGISLYEMIPFLKDSLKSLPYIVYRGSLTTPPCYETVTWMVFLEPIKIPYKDIHSWQRLKGSDGNPLCNNFRPLQEINGRNIFFINPQV